MLPFPFQSLLNWSKTHGRDELPWRQYFHLSVKDLGYHIWLSEILLQQTQVDRVIGYYLNILKHFPTIESLAHASYEEFFPYYQGLGYYSRARNMLKAANMVVVDYGGVFPNEREKLIKLPGVGPYTAAAIQAFVYDESVLSFDTNLEKIFSRYYHGSRFQKLSQEEKIAIEKDFKATGISGRVINAAFMDFGSLVSVNNTLSAHSPHPNPLLEGEGVKSEKNPPSPSRRRVGDEVDKVKRGLGGEADNLSYPLPDCKWFETRGTLEIQEKKKKIVFPTKDAQLIVILHENHRIYYSSSDSGYLPFTLPPTEENIRHFVQEYFRTKHHLELSVRPIHDKYFENDMPFVVCNAQIQKGSATFPRYRKENGIFMENP